MLDCVRELQNQMLSSQNNGVKTISEVRFHFEQTSGQAPPDYTALIDPADPITVGQQGTWDIVVTVGAQGIAIGGGVRIAPPHREKQRWDVGNVVASYQRSRHERARDRS